MKKQPKLVVTRLAIALTGALFSIALGAKGTPYLFEARTNTIVDRQTAEAIGPRASVVIIRASVKGESPEYELTDLIARLKASTKAPVLDYAWSNRAPSKGRNEAELVKGLDAPPLAKSDDAESGAVEYLDITNPKLRHEIVARLVSAKSRLNVDGFFFDVSTRTPNHRPAALADRCRADAGFCPKYASGMDALFAEMREGLGAGTQLSYNGLFNFDPGQIQDQVKLLTKFNTVIIEFFGMDPKEKKHAFSRDILPFLQTMATVPPDKGVIAFGRSTWNYSDYAEDYRWQRYLYASFLLAARENDSFKQLASFQIPAHRGRSGGLDFYSDWEATLGDPRGKFEEQGGIYVREFEAGMVAVAPDDGRGGTVHLRRSYLTTEGETLKGPQQLRPGDALLLVTGEGHLPTRPAAHSIDAEKMARWKWSGATLKNSPAGPVIALEPVGEDLRGEHDILLDYERSLSPYTRLDVAVPGGLRGEMFVVAEVDDARKEHMFAMVRVTTNKGRAEVALAESMPYRTRSRTAKAEDWPMVTYSVPAGGESVSLDGPTVFNGTPFKFRRWAHLRPAEPMSLASVTLSQPRPIGR